MKSSSLKLSTKRGHDIEKMEKNSSWEDLSRRKGKGINDII